MDKQRILAFGGERSGQSESGIFCSQKEDYCCFFGEARMKVMPKFCKPVLNRKQLLTIILELCFKYIIIYTN